MFSSLTGHYDKLVNAIIRPPRDVYVDADLGPERGQIAGLAFERQDLKLQNPRGLKIVCSHFFPYGQMLRRFPCVIYLHGNSSSRCEAISILSALLYLPATVFCFDFAGSGNSDGEYVSLGYWEKDDLSTVVDYLRSLKTVDCIGIWGRSMGAVTALMHADRDPSLAGLVLDSPFTNLRLLARELVESGRYVNGYVSKLLVDVVLSFMKSTIVKKAEFDIDKLVPINHVGQTFVPALFAAGEKDNFILPHHAKELFDAYAGEDKLWVSIKDNDHNNVRPQTFIHEVTAFFWRALQCDQSVPVGRDPPPLSDYEAPPFFRIIRSRSRPGNIAYEDLQTGKRYASINQARRIAVQRLEDGEVDNPQEHGTEATHIENEFLVFRTWTTEDLVSLGFSRDLSEEASRTCQSLSLESAVAWLCDSDHD